MGLLEGFGKIFKRGSKIAEAEANSAMDKLEDPVVMTQQAIRDMDGQIIKAVEAQSKVKAQAIKHKADVAKLKADSKEWMAKANKLRAKYEIDPKNEEIKGLIIDCLNKVENLNNEAASKKKIADNATKKEKQIGTRIKSLKKSVDEAKMTLEDLRTRSEVAKAEKEINEDLAGIGDDSAMNMIEKMKTKVAKEEAEAEAYAEIADEDKPLDSKIDELLGADSPTEDNELFENFLKK